MAKKRGNGEGSLHKRSNGSWEAQVSLEGHRLSRTFKSFREGQEWLKKTIIQIDDGMTLTSTKISVGEYFHGWLTSIKSSIRETSWIHYESLIRCYIIPNIGKIRLIDLRPDIIQNFYDHLIANGCGIPTVLKLHFVLHCGLERAVAVGMVPRNPARYVRRPKKIAKEMEILTDDEVTRLLLASKGHRLEALVHLAVVTGAREMELLGLSWEHIDWVKKTVRIDRQLCRTSRHGIVKFSPPKTHYGKRVISLGKVTIDLLRQHLMNQELERLAAGDKWVESNLVFTTIIGTPMDNSKMRRAFKSLLTISCLPIIRFHSLRHTCASLLLSQGIPVIEVSRRLGHSRPSITLDVYGHLIPGLHSEIGDMLDELITPIPVHIDRKAI
jgi:integrase